MSNTAATIVRAKKSNATITNVVCDENLQRASTRMRQTGRNAMFVRVMFALIDNTATEGFAMLAQLAGGDNVGNTIVDLANATGMCGIVETDDYMTRFEKFKAAMVGQQGIVTVFSVSIADLAKGFAGHETETNVYANVGNSVRTYTRLRRTELGDMDNDAAKAEFLARTANELSNNLQKEEGTPGKLYWGSIQQQQQMPLGGVTIPQGNPAF